jgi:DNA-nicking Smr family endonuclease
VNDQTDRDVTFLRREETFQRPGQASTSIGTRSKAPRTVDDHSNDPILFEQPDPVEIPINGVLDLHTFSPKDLPDLLDDYLEACLERDIYDLRIIHGKGKGILRDRVRAILSRHAQVQSFSEAPLEAGGWGATVVRLKDRSVQGKS